MHTDSELTLNQLISRIKVMYLAVFANGKFNENQKTALNDEFEKLGLQDDTRFVSRKLAQRQRAELESNFHEALDHIFFSLERCAVDTEFSHQLLELYLTIAESDGFVTDAEEVLAKELADVLNLDIEYYLVRMRTD